MWLIWGQARDAAVAGEKARKVIAVDNSPKMVEFGSRLAKKHGFDNLEYRLGNIEDPPIAKNSIDLAILSQALHHAIHPERAIDAAHRILKRGGRLVILDLLSHRFEKARELYADHWLGFSEVKLHQLLERSGFRQIEVSVVSREKDSPHFQTVFATGLKGTRRTLFMSNIRRCRSSRANPNSFYERLLRGSEAPEGISRGDCIRGGELGNRPGARASTACFRDSELRDPGRDCVNVGRLPGRACDGLDV
jgi:ubiquinone/menaquinone biosynthesis C-methylase UbiE